VEHCNDTALTHYSHVAATGLGKQVPMGLLERYFTGQMPFLVPNQKYMRWQRYYWSVTSNRGQCKSIH